MGWAKLSVVEEQGSLCGGVFLEGDSGRLRGAIWLDRQRLDLAAEKMLLAGPNGLKEGYSVFAQRIVIPADTVVLKGLSDCLQA